MMVFETFVFVHLPKTGGTFVETILKRIHCPHRLGQKIHAMRRRWGVKIPLYPYRYREYVKHSPPTAIPAEDRDKIILSCVRSPYDLYVSHYKFGWWRTNPGRWFAPGSAMLQRAEDDPQSISFADWVLGSGGDALWVHHKKRSHPDIDLGWASIEFAQYFCRTADDIYPLRDNEARMAEAFRAGAYNVHFLRMGNLNEQLYQFLLEQGYDRDGISFIRTEPKIYPGRVTRTASDSVDKFFTPELMAEVRRRERLLFALFPEFDAKSG